MKEKKGYKRVSLEDLLSIFVMRSRKSSIQAIATSVKRGKSTVSNILNKYQNCNWVVWHHMSASDRARHVLDQMRKTRKSRNTGCLRDPEVRAHVIKCLVDDHWSPEEIAGSIGKHLPGKSVSTKTIYNFIKKERKDLTEHLSERGKPRRQRVMHRRGRFKQAAPKKTSIHERPEEINARTETGHYEGDLIITGKKKDQDGNRGTGAILSLTERRSRNKIYRLIPDTKAETVLAYLRAVLKVMSAKSLTLDNGSEFAYSELIKLETEVPGLKIYYCDPYCSWQKGSVERSNREFRWYYPKGTDFGKLTSCEVRRIEEKINRRPMKCHGFLSPAEVFSMAA